MILFNKRKRLENSRKEAEKLIADYNKESFLLLSEIQKNLKLVNFYNNYDKLLSEADKEFECARERYSKWKTNKRLNEMLEYYFKRLKLKHTYNKINLAEIEKTLKEYEKYVDKKYWDFEILEDLKLYIRIKVADTIEDAIAIVEKELNNPPRQ